MDQCGNTFDCYSKLKRDLTKYSIHKTNQQWLDWGHIRNEMILQKTHLKRILPLLVWELRTMISMPA